MKFSRILILFLLVSVFSRHAHSDIIDYGDVNGDTVTFASITETSATTHGAVYGAPIVGAMGGAMGMGDTISFVPFGLQGLSTGEIDFEEGRLSFHIAANTGYQIDSIELLEASSFFLWGIDSNVMSSSFGVANAAGSLFSGNAITEMAFGSAAGQNSFASSFLIELPSVQQATFTLDSRLFASALGAGGVASISKDALMLRINTSLVAVPEPASTTLVFVLTVIYGIRRLTRQRCSSL